MANGRRCRRIGTGDGLVVLIFFVVVVDGVVVVHDRDGVVSLPGAEQGVMRSESFGRLGSPETILGRAEVGPEKDTRKNQGREREGQKTKEAVMKRREYNKEEDGTRVSSQCPVVSCRIVLYRKEVEWVEGGRRGEKRKPGARSQEPEALRGARTRTRKSNPPPPNRKLLYKADKSAWKRRAGARNRGNSRNACMGKLGPDAAQPFSLSQPNREELCHLSLAVWGSLGIWDSGSADWIRAHSNSVPAARI